MKNTPYDGGPAFPVPEAYHADSVELYQSADTGMTLRDWFAGQALVGILAGDFGRDLKNAAESLTSDGREQSRAMFGGVAIAAYDAADRMLAVKAGGAA